MGGGSPASPTYTLLLRGPCSGWPVSSSLPLCSSLSAGPHTAGLAVWLPFTGSPAAWIHGGAGQAFTARPGTVFRARSH